MALQIQINREIVVTKPVALSSAIVADPEVRPSIPLLEGRLTLNATSTPDLEKGYAARLQLSGSSLVIDLAALADLGGTTLDMTGKNLRVFSIAAAEANSAALVVTAGDSEGCLLYGTGGSVTVPAGGFNTHYPAGSGAAIVNNTTDKIKVASSDTDAIFDVVIGAG